MLPFYFTVESNTESLTEKGEDKGARKEKRN